MRDALERAWRHLSVIDPMAQQEARAQLHHAIQLASVCGERMVPSEFDGSHKALSYIPGTGLLATRRGAVAEPIRVAVRIDDLMLYVIGGSGTALAELSLPGRTMAEGLAWLRGELPKHGARLSDPVPDRVERQLAPHALGDGAAFEVADPSALEELARWYGNAEKLLRYITTLVSSASPVVCWPRGADIVTMINTDLDSLVSSTVDLIGLDLGESELDPRTIRVGLSPGDIEVPEPYWYVRPHPLPAMAELPELSGSARWVRGRHTSAVLLGWRLLEYESGPEQAECVLEFLKQAIDHCRALLARRL